MRQSRTALESEAVSHITPVGTMRITTERIDDERIVSEGNFMELKIGKNIYDVDERDLLLDNGSCFQLVTSSCGIGLDSQSPAKLSKKLVKDLKKSNAIYTNDDLKMAAEGRYYSGVTFWKFDIEKMKQLA